MSSNKEPKIIKVESFGNGKYIEQIQSPDGSIKYVFYRPPNAIMPNESLSYDSYYMGEGDSEKQIQYVPIKDPHWLLADEPSTDLTDSSLFDDIKAYYYAHVDFSDDFRLYDVSTAWTMATWIKEASNISPYYRLFGSKATGKTRVQEVQRQLCFHAILTASCTEPALFRLVQDYDVTLLLDEAEQYSSELKQAVQSVLNTGYRKGSKALRCEPTPDGKQAVVGFSTFGFKSIASTELLRDTLESRCVPVVMQRKTREVNFNVNENHARKLRNRLLIWRFRRLANLDEIRSDDSDESDTSDGFLGGGGGLCHLIKDSRIVEIFAPLIALTEDPTSRQNIIDFALSVYEENVEEDATSSEAQIVTSILETQTVLESGKFSVTQVTSIFNLDKNESEKWDTRAMGRAIKKLGFKQKRMTGGKRGYLWEFNHVTKLCDRYDLPHPINNVTNGKTSQTSLDKDSYKSTTKNEKNAIEFTPVRGSFRIFEKSQDSGSQPSLREESEGDVI